MKLAQKRRRESRRTYPLGPINTHHLSLFKSHTHKGPKGGGGFKVILEGGGGKTNVKGSAALGGREGTEIGMQGAPGCSSKGGKETEKRPPTRYQKVRFKRGGGGTRGSKKKKKKKIRQEEEAWQPNIKGGPRSRKFVEHFCLTTGGWGLITLA